MVCCKGTKESFDKNGAACEILPSVSITRVFEKHPPACYKTLWLFCVDDTRIVPPAARNLISYRGQSREELERHVLALLEQIKIRAEDDDSLIRRTLI